MLTAWSVVSYFILILGFFVVFMLASSHEVSNLLLKTWPGLTQPRSEDDRVPNTKGALIIAALATFIMALIHAVIICALC